MDEADPLAQTDCASTAVKMWEHLRKGVEEFVVSGHGVSVNSKNVTLPNNHEESDLLMIHCLTLVEVTGKIVSIYSNDTDVFVTLLGNYHKFSMKRLLICTGRRKCGLISLRYMKGKSPYWISLL